MTSSDVFEWLMVDSMRLTKASDGDHSARGFGVSPCHVYLCHVHRVYARDTGKPHRLTRVVSASHSRSPIVDTGEYVTTSFREPQKREGEQWLKPRPQKVANHETKTGLVRIMRYKRKWLELGATSRTHSALKQARKPQSAVWRGNWGQDDLMSGKGGKGSS